jgi:hypothetical protein
MMHDLQTRVLPRLMIDTIHCLWLAHDHLESDLRGATRHAITALRNTDMTDTERAGSALLNAATYLAAVEKSLAAADRPYTAKKLRDVRRRVECITLI